MFRRGLGRSELGVSCKVAKRWSYVPVRILLITQFYPPIIGGEERHVRNLGAALARRGHDVSVATLWFPGASAFEMDGQVGVYRMRGLLQYINWLFTDPQRRHAPPFPDPGLLVVLARLLREVKPEVVHAHNWLVHSLVPLKLLVRAPLVMTLHDYSLTCPKKNLVHQGSVCSGPGLRRCAICASAHYGATKGPIITITHRMSSMFLRGTVRRFLTVSKSVQRFNRLSDNPSVSEVVSNFVPDDLAQLTSDVDTRVAALPEAGYILFVGDLMHLKGADVLVQAYALLKDMPPLVLIGRECPDTPKDLPPNVMIFNNWPHQSVMQAWARCLFGVLPSVGPEACATVVMEAMALGKPMIVSDIGGMPELVEHGVNGLIVRPNDVGSLADALRSMVDAPKMRRGMSAASLVRAGQLKASSVTDRIEAIYHEVVTLQSSRLASPSKHLDASHIA
jgi:glycosyltransferase involved in cell wall biosynthesis